MKMIRVLLQKYIEWEISWCMPKLDLRPGEEVQVNWKYRVMFPDSKVHSSFYHVSGCNPDTGEVIMMTRESFSRYWLTRRNFFFERGRKG